MTRRARARASVQNGPRFRARRATCRALSKSSRTLASDSPNHIVSSSGPFTEMKLAYARARRSRGRGAPLERWCGFAGGSEATVGIIEGMGREGSRALHSLAIAFASSVLPQPGGP